MYTVLVKYRLPRPVPREALLEGFKQAIPKFENAPGLIRKYFCYDEAAHTGHSVYLMESEEVARAFFNDTFMEAMKGTFQATPELFFVDTLLVIEQGKVTANPA